MRSVLKSTALHRTIVAGSVAVVVGLIVAGPLGSSTAQTPPATSGPAALATGASYAIPLPPQSTSGTAAAVPATSATTAATAAASATAAAAPSATAAATAAATAPATGIASVVTAISVSALPVGFVSQAGTVTGGGLSAALFTYGGTPIAGTISNGVLTLKGPANTAVFVVSGPLIFQVTLNSAGSAVITLPGM